MAMDKRDVWPFVALLALLFAWPAIDRMIAKKFFPDHAPPARPSPAGSAGGEPAREPLAPSIAGAGPLSTSAKEATTEPESDEPPDPHAPARLITLTNARADFVFSTRGAALTAVTLREYRATIAKDSGPMILDFTSRPALAYERAPGFGATHSFEVVEESARRVTFARAAASGLRLERTVELGDGYVLRVADRLVNTGDAAIELPSVLLRTGPMRREPGQRDGAGIISLGVDTLSPGGEDVRHWGGKIEDLFEAEMEERGLKGLPLVYDAPPRDHPVDWIAAKNKYFVQILTPPEGAGERAWIYARRAPAPRESDDPAFAPRRMTEIVEVGAAVELAGGRLDPGQSVERVCTLYAGPMKYSELHAMRLHQADVMEFGMWAPIGKLLLRVLNAIHDYIPPHNYGIAIILLTIIVRIVFWPITHKSTESMKRMAAVAPLVNQIREKYKDNPQKMQQEIMALYKAHKVNPLGGCLPMLIQIPVFIALFVVLRSAIELRFANFLWIRDLSEPENLLPGLLPFGLPLNILPILMAGTMYLQMKLSPSAGDPAQHKIMAVMMPAMMLVFLYNFASGLALYWTTQNILMIIQQLMMKKNVTPLPVPEKAAGKK
jgi:YidC/Oxa1 family membrane protein insertase